MSILQTYEKTFEKIDIIYQDQNMVAIYKPPGYHVHPPEDGFLVPRHLICLYQVRNLLNQYIFPVHRLDAPTCGVLLFALNQQAARELALALQKQMVEKVYYAVVRGWLQTQGVIELPLELDSTSELVPAMTEFQTLAQIEVPIAVGKRHATARYSLVKVSPKTGRFHQIRRHFQRIHHPLIGDTRHGDSHHNRFFREHFQVGGLCLWAERLHLKTESQADGLTLISPLPDRWKSIQEIFAHEIGLVSKV